MTGSRSLSFHITAEPKRRITIMARAMYERSRVEAEQQGYPWETLPWHKLPKEERLVWLDEARIIMRKVMPEFFWTKKEIADAEARASARADYFRRGLEAERIEAIHDPT